MVYTTLVESRHRVPCRTMKSRIKSFVKRSLSYETMCHIHYLTASLPKLPMLAKAKKAYDTASTTPEYLDPSQLKWLQSAYPLRSSFSYSPESTEARGIDRACQLLKLRGARQATKFLEIGCWDGMVSLALKRMGKEVTGIDFRSDGFDQRAIDEPIELLQMDAENLALGDSTYDFVFSYGSFEHFKDPERVLREATRVVRPGGYIYLEFGPLYYSAFGEHAYRSISVPYCQFLFQQDELNVFAASIGKDLIDFDHVNKWHLNQYLNLWKKMSNEITIVSNSQLLRLDQLDLICKYPSCFKSKSRDFNDFTVSHLAVLFTKNAS